MKRARVSLAQAIADSGSREAFKEAWKQREYVLEGRRGSPTAAYEEIPAAASDHCMLYSDRGMVEVVTGKPLTNPSLVERFMWGGPFEHEYWYDVWIEPTRATVLLAEAAGVAADTTKAWKPRPGKQLTPSDKAVLAAVRHNWPDGQLDHKAKVRNDHVRSWLKQQSKSDLSDRTIQRALEKIFFN